jgi:probable dihydroxyacetone kinase regulator
MKQILAESLEDLMNERQIGKISVSEIVSNCETTRQTFYNNFKDKYDLMTWVYLSDEEKYTNRLWENYTWRDSTLDTCKFLFQKRRFYLSAFSEHGQNSLFDYAINHTLDDSIEYIKKQRRYAKIEGELLFGLKLYFGGMMKLCLEWLKGDISLNPEQMFTMTMKCMPEMVKRELI